MRSKLSMVSMFISTEYKFRNYLSRIALFFVQSAIKVIINA